MSRTYKNILRTNFRDQELEQLEHLNFNKIVYKNCIRISDHNCKDSMIKRIRTKSNFTQQLKHVDERDIDSKISNLGLVDMIFFCKVEKHWL